MPKKASSKSTVSSTVLEDEKTQYSSLEPREHCIARPGMYIGSIYPSKVEFYSVNNDYFCLNYAVFWMVTIV
jgi:hypothetical protein